MTASNLIHPQNDQVFTIRKSYIDMCKDKNAGILLSYLESTDVNNVPQPHTRQELYDGCLGTVSLKGIDASRKILKKLNFITEQKNPNKRYCFDNRIFYKLERENIAKKFFEYEQEI